MSKEDLNHEDRDDEIIDEEEEQDSDDQESPDSNEPNGDDSEGASALSDDSLAEYNKRVGKDYKSWDDVVSSEKEADKKFAHSGSGKKEKKGDGEREQSPSPTQSPVLKTLYFKANPEAELIWDDVTEEAEKLGRDPFELYENSAYFKGEAKARADAEKEEKEAKSKISNSSDGTRPEKTDYSKMSFEDAKKLSDAEYEKWSEAHE